MNGLQGSLLFQGDLTSPLEEAWAVIALPETGQALKGPVPQNLPDQNRPRALSRADER
jgi:hypothetical protein